MHKNTCVHTNKHSINIYIYVCVRVCAYTYTRKLLQNILVDTYICIYDIYIFGNQFLQNIIVDARSTVSIVYITSHLKHLLLRQRLKACVDT